ncbi:MAG: hypothetical protein HGB12_04275 [Bacteroidetes bacterium]|nr:hypothetical protein [Bacteroidota bacterium]
MINFRFLKIIIIFLLVVFTKQVYCTSPPPFFEMQGKNNSQRSKVVMGLYLGVTSYFGDLNNNSLSIPLYRRYGAQIFIEREMYKNIRLSTGFFIGNIFGEERTILRNLNFKTTLFAPQFGVSYKMFDFYQKRFSAFFYAGMELFFFSSSGNLSNNKDETYFYWSDGTVRNLPEIPANLGTASVISIDPYYETDYRNSNIDNVVDYPRTSFAIPVGLSLEANLNRGFALRAGAIYHYTFTDYLDNITTNSIGSRKGNSATDKFLFSYVGFVYNLPVAKIKRPSLKGCGFEKNQIDHKKVAKLRAK